MFLAGVLSLVLMIGLALLIWLSPAHDLECNGFKKFQREALGEDYHCYIGP